MYTPEHYVFSCPDCGGVWVTEVVTNMVERNALSSFDITLDNDGSYRLIVDSYDESHVSQTKESTSYISCGKCNRELTQEDLMRLAFDNTL